MMSPGQKERTLTQYVRVRVRWSVTLVAFLHHREVDRPDGYRSGNQREGQNPTQGFVGHIPNPFIRPGGVVCVLNTVDACEVSENGGLVKTWLFAPSGRARTVRVTCQ